jgi:hypothetical protein
VTCVWASPIFVGWAVAVTASADHEVVDRRRSSWSSPGCRRHQSTTRAGVSMSPPRLRWSRRCGQRSFGRRRLRSTTSHTRCPRPSGRSRSESGRWTSPIARCSPNSHTLVAGTSTCMTRGRLSVRWSACSPSGSSRSCMVLGRGWGCAGRWTIGPRPLRRSWAAESATQDVSETNERVWSADPRGSTHDRAAGRMSSTRRPRPGALHGATPPRVRRMPHRGSHVG